MPEMPMLRTTLFVFVGGGLGAGARELLMLGVPHAFDGFPLDILAANVIAPLCSA
jgi:CrcB protein